MFAQSLGSYGALTGEHKVLMDAFHLFYLCPSSPYVLGSIFLRSSSDSVGM